MKKILSELFIFILPNSNCSRPSSKIMSKPYATTKITLQCSNLVIIINECLSCDFERSH